MSWGGDWVREGDGRREGGWTLETKVKVLVCVCCDSREGGSSTETWEVSWIARMALLRLERVVFRI